METPARAGIKSAEIKSAEIKGADRTVKTSLYLPASLLAQVRAAAKREGVSSAALIRSAVASVVDAHQPPPIGGFLGRNTGESRE